MDNTEERLPVICTFCKKDFSPKKTPRKTNKNNFCSRNCYASYRSEFYRGSNGGNWKGGQLKKQCKYCGNDYHVYQYRNRTSGYCSVSCSAYDNVPDNFRRPKLTCKTVNDLRNTPEYYEWRASVYLRDYWTCCLCGYKGNKIVAHHIYNFHEIQEKRFDVYNGITLCTKCHARIHVCKKDTIFFLENLVKSVTAIRGTSPDYAGVKIWSELHGNMQRQAELETTCP